MAKDVQALSLAGTKKWWPRKMLEKFAMAHLALPVGKVGQIFEEVAEAVSATRGMIAEHAADQPGFRDVGARTVSVRRGEATNLLPGPLWLVYVSLFFTVRFQQALT
jgi:serine/threonine-protein kinase HipA